jgi:hypothetical protein
VAATVEDSEQDEDRIAAALTLVPLQIGMRDIPRGVMITISCLTRTTADETRWIDMRVVVEKGTDRVGTMDVRSGVGVEVEISIGIQDDPRGGKNGDGHGRGVRMIAEIEIGVIGKEDEVSRCMEAKTSTECNLLKLVSSLSGDMP